MMSFVHTVVGLPSYAVSTKSTDSKSINLKKPSVCTEHIFDSRPFMYIKIFLKDLLQNIVVHIFTLLLAPFTPKLVNYSRHSESLKYV